MAIYETDVSGNTKVFGTSSNEKIVTGSGNDKINASGGSDTVNSGSSNDTFYHNISENFGSIDSYVAGSGSDTLQLLVTKSQYDAIIASRILTDFANVSSTQKFDFAKYNLGFQFKLTIQGFEKIVLDIRPTATNDFFTANEDLVSNFSSILANDDDAITNGAFKVINSVQNSTSTNADGSYDVVSALGASIHVNADGTFIYNPTNASNIQSLSAGQIGHDFFVYSIKETDSLSSYTNITSAKVNIDVTGANDSPVARNDSASLQESITPTPAADLTGTVLVNDSDIDSLDILSVTSLAPMVGSYGTLVLQSNGLYAYSFNNTSSEALSQGEVVHDVFTYSISDGHGGVSSANLDIMITGTNDVPIAQNDLASLQESLLPNPAADLTGNVLINDTDIDSFDTLSVTTLAPIVGTYGSLTFEANGTYTYTFNDTTSEALFEGQTVHDVFTYNISDGRGGVSSANLDLTITGTNDAPIARNDLASLQESVAPSPAVDLTGNVLANDSDSDNVGSDTLFVTTVAPMVGSYGSLTIQANGTYAYVLNDTTSETLSQGQVVHDIFTYSISDDRGEVASADVDISITGTNDAPIARNDLASLQESNVPKSTVDLSGNVLANDSDIDSLDSLSVTSLASMVGSYGTLRIQANGTYTYTFNDTTSEALSLGQVAHDIFSYSVSDSHGGVASANLDISITGTNDGPIARNDLASLQESAVPNLAVDLSGNVLNNDSDIDSLDSLSVTSLAPLVGSYGTLTIQPNGSYAYSLNNTSSEALSQGQIVHDIFTYNISDGHGGGASATLDISITGTNDAPIASTDVASLQESIAPNPVVDLSGNVLANDSDIDSLDSLSVTSLAPLVGSYGTLTMQADGNYAYSLNNTSSEGLSQGQVVHDIFSYSISDGHGGVSSSTLDISITGTNDAPIANNDGQVGSTNENSTLVILASSLLNNDSDVDAGNILSINSVAGDSHISLVNGNVVFNPGSDFTYLNAGETAIVNFTYVIQDQFGALSNPASASVTVTGLNPILVPVANDDTLNNNVNDSISTISIAMGNVLANDSDPNGFSLHVLAASSVSISGISPNLFGGGFTISNWALAAGEAAHFIIDTTGNFDNTQVLADGLNLSNDNDIPAHLIVMQDGSVFLIKNNAFDFLPQDQNLLLSFNYTVQNSGGLTSTALANFSISGLDNQDYVASLTAATLFGGLQDDVLIGSAGDDTLYGDDGNDYIQGGDGADNIIGGLGNDTMEGNGGNDTITAGNFQFDVIDGGAGNDLIFGGSSAFSVFFLGSLRIDGGDGDDSIIGFGTNRMIVEGGAGNDIISFGFATDQAIYQNAGPNVLSGGLGDDTITGFRFMRNFIQGDEGSDIITSGFESDQIHGGLDNDIIRISANGHLIYGDAGDDTILNIGSVTNSTIDGGDGNDTINMNNSVFGGSGNTIVGGNGNDLINGFISSVNNISGNAGDDIIFGGSSIDTLTGNEGNDTLHGGSGNDTLSGNEGNDTLYGDAGNDNLNGHDGDDEIHGGDGNDIISGGEGNDILYGDGGSDTIYSGNGFNTIDGGEGIDKLDYSDLTQGISVNLNSNTPIPASINRVDTIVFVNGLPTVEGIIGTAFDDFFIADGFDADFRGQGGNDTIFTGIGNDYLEGGVGNDQLSSGLGNDTLIGGDGNDILTGGDGNDYLNGGLGDDSLDGGSGTNTISYNSVNLGVTVNLTLSTQNTGQGIDTLAFAGGLSTFANIDGSNQNDTLIGDSQNNIINGLQGNDIIDGGAGDDTLNGGDGALGGNDIITGGLGNDIINGSTGVDTAVFTTIYPFFDLSNGGLQVIGLNGEGTDYLYNIEKVQLGSEIYQVKLGTDGADSSFAFFANVFGNELIVGGNGNDLLYAYWQNSGHDIFVGGSGNDVFNLEFHEAVQGEGSLLIGAELGFFGPNYVIADFQLGSNGDTLQIDGAFTWARRDNSDGTISYFHDPVTTASELDHLYANLEAAGFPNTVEITSNSNIGGGPEIDTVVKFLYGDLGTITFLDINFDHFTDIQSNMTFTL